MRLDLLHQDAAEHVGPGVVRAPADAGCRDGGGSASRSVAPSAPSVAIRSMPAKRAKASATVSRSGSAKGSASRPRKAKRRAPARLGRQRQQRRAVLHQHLVGLVRPVPFQHGELGMVQRRRARGCGTPVPKLKMRLSPAASSFLQANSGEV